MQFHTWPKDRLSLKVPHFAALILRIDIQTKVLYLQEFANLPGRGTNISERSDQFVAHNFEAVLAVTGDTIFSSLYQEV